jgi:hypothetical protein
LLYKRGSLMKKQSVILLHVLIWATLSTVYFFCSEMITVWLLPEIYDVTMWLSVMIGGLLLILILVGASLMISLRKRAEQVNNQK